LDTTDHYSSARDLANLSRYIIKTKDYPLHKEKEVSHLGIKVTIIAPSGFRTDWAGRSANNAKMNIEDYKETAHANQNNIRNASGNQAGDPLRAAKAIIKAAESEKPPLRLLLGAAALRGARNKITELQADFNEWEETTIGADHPKE
jgi:hypothetical protein